MKRSPPSPRVPEENKGKDKKSRLSPRSAASWLRKAAPGPGKHPPAAGQTERKTPAPAERDRPAPQPDAPFGKELFLRHAWLFPTLLAIVLLGLIALVNRFTAEPIRAGAEAAEYNALAAVMADADHFEPMERPEGTDGRITGLYSAFSGTTHVGWCMQISPVGARGVIQMVVGVFPAGQVTGVFIVSHEEADTLGAAIENEAFLHQYVGKKQLVEGYIAELPGAKITSRAVSEGVRLALDLAQTLRGAGSAAPQGEEAGNP